MKVISLRLAVENILLSLVASTQERSVGYEVETEKELDVIHLEDHMTKVIPYRFERL